MNYLQCLYLSTSAHNLLTALDLWFSAPVELSRDELNAMRYACGYVPRSPLKKYKSKSGAAYSQYVRCLGDVAVKEEGGDLFTYTRKWFDQVNRGGLFPLNDNTFTLFVEIEIKMCACHITKAH